MTVYRTHKYCLSQICTFTNRGTSGVTSNDGRQCQVVRLKPPDEWVSDEAGYVVEFSPGGHGLGVRESELEPVPIDEVRRISDTPL